MRREKKRTRKITKTKERKMKTTGKKMSSCHNNNQQNSHENSSLKRTHHIRDTREMIHSNDEE